MHNHKSNSIKIIRINQQSITTYSDNKYKPNSAFESLEQIALG